MRKTVLLVDDSRVARMMARRVVELAHPQWDIIEAASGEEALEQASANPPDYVVLDVNMPGIGGLETARLMKAAYPSARITLLTANIQDPVRIQAEGMGLSFLAKPIREDQLRAFLSDGSPS